MLRCVAVHRADLCAYIVSPNAATGRFMLKIASDGLPHFLTSIIKQPKATPGSDVFKGLCGNSALAFMSVSRRNQRLRASAPTRDNDLPFERLEPSSIRDVGAISVSPRGSTQLCRGTCDEPVQMTDR